MICRCFSEPVVRTPIGVRCLCRKIKTATTKKFREMHIDFDFCLERDSWKVVCSYATEYHCTFKHGVQASDRHNND